MQLPEDVYQTIEAKSEGLFKDKGSRFLAFAYPVNSENDVREIIAGLRKEHHGARHFCYAWRIGTENINFRANDDGEPSSTAGKPILGQLISYNLTNILVVVVRYFGGTLLGTSGLINAYKSSASEALKNAVIIQKTIETEITIAFTYKEMAEVMNAIKHENLTILQTSFEEKCWLRCSVRKNNASRIQKILTDIYGVKLINP